MKNMVGFRQSRNHGLARITAVCALLTVVAAAAIAGPAEPQPRACPLQGSWLAQVDIGGIFFVQYGTPGPSGGPLTIEWIRFDPTLFGNFPSAVRVTNGAGTWKSTAEGYAYTWIAYGVDASGQPVYSVRTSGKGALDGCDAIKFDYVVEVFPFPMDPLHDQPVTCLSGTGSKARIPVTPPVCN